LKFDSDVMSAFALSALFEFVGATAPAIGPACWTGVALLRRSGAERGSGAAGTRCGAGAVAGRVGVDGVAGVRGEGFVVADFGAGFVPDRILLLLIS